MAGEVIAVGEDVKDWKAGDRVCANFFLEKLNDEQTPETDGSALGDPVDGVLTEYRTFPAHVRARLFTLYRLLSLDLRSRSWQSRLTYPTRKHRPSRAFSLCPQSSHHIEPSCRCAALTAYNALYCGYAPLKAGETVLVQGTGGVSMCVSLSLHITTLLIAFFQIRAPICRRRRRNRHRNLLLRREARNRQETRRNARYQLPHDAGLGPRGFEDHRWGWR
jgi:hypothetical protein